MPRTEKLRSTSVRGWLDETKKRMREGRADTSVAAALEAIPGWSDERVVGKTSRPIEQKWQEQWLGSFERLKLLEEAGVDLAGLNTMFVGSDGFQAGYWISGQRQKYRMGAMSDERIALLESLQTWSWSKRDDAFAKGLQSVSRYLAREGHANPPHRYRDEEGFGLSDWIDKQRRKHRAGKMQPHQVKALQQFDGWKWNLPMGRRAEPS